MASESIVLPVVGQQVRVRADALSVICTVRETHPERLTLDGIVEHAGGPAQVVFAHARGVAALSGELRVGAPLHAFRVEGCEPLQQRRETFRVPVSGRTRVVRGDGTVDHVELKDLSPQGARVLSQAPTKLGEPLTIDLELSGTQLEVTGRVARVDDRGYGIRFDDLARSDESLLSRYLVDQQRRRVRSRD